MDTPQQALDALQREVNLILEQTGRLFVAANNSAPEAALARASRLKQQLPVSHNRFHQALDVLDEELQFAKAVMRRDLAVARGKSGAQVAPEPAPAPASETKITERPLQTKAQPSEPEVTTSSTEQPNPPQPEPAQEKQPSPVPSPKKRSSPSLEDGGNSEPVAKKQAVGDEKPSTSETQASEPKLGLDTKPADPASGEQPSEDKAPDTATFSNTGDLDSLFNDPASAGGMGGENDEGADFGASADLNAEFDFGSFGADMNNDAPNDNDNISALLPGLQDYANENAGNDVDFNSLFTTEATTNQTSQTQNTETTGGDQQNDGTQRDTTFDDFLDLTFDMSGNENQNGGNDFNFDFS